MNNHIEHRRREIRPKYVEKEQLGIGHLPQQEVYSKKRIAACLAGEERPTKRSDIDNYCKAIFDGMNGIVYVNDSLVVNLHSTKNYGTVGMVEVMVKEDIN